MFHAATDPAGRPIVGLPLRRSGSGHGRILALYLASSGDPSLADIANGEPDQLPIIRDIDSHANPDANSHANTYTNPDPASRYRAYPRDHLYKAMTIAVKNPTPGDLYSFYEIVNGSHVLLGTSTTGNFTPATIRRGTHTYAVRVTRNGIQEKIDSNLVTYRKKRK